MESKDIENIRKTLDAVEKMTSKANAKSKMEVLAMLGKTSQSVIAMAKKLTEPKTKTRTKVVTQYKDKPQQAQQPQSQPTQTKTGNPPETATDKPATPFQSITPQPPVSPLSNQRTDSNES